MKMKTRDPRIKKKSNKNYYIILLGAMIIVIMVGSAMDLWKNDKNEGAYEYKGLKFTQTEAGWMAYKADNSQLVLFTNPAELANMTIPSVNTDMLNYYSKIYLSYNPKERVRTALSQFIRNIPITPLVVQACTVDNELCKDLPLKTCEDAGEGIGVIVFEESNITDVNFKNDCLTIKGKDLTKIVDKMIAEKL
jgi:hypothetical protein